MERLLGVTKEYSRCLKQRFLSCRVISKRRRCFQCHILQGGRALCPWLPFVPLCIALDILLLLQAFHLFCCVFTSWYRCAALSCGHFSLVWVQSFCNPRCSLTLCLMPLAAAVSSVRCCQHVDRQRTPQLQRLCSPAPFTGT